MRILDLVFSDLVFGLGVPLLITAGGILLSDEFKRFKAAKICFYLAAAWICGRVLMWSIFTSDAAHVRIVATFLAFGIVGVGLTEAIRATDHRENSLSAEQEPSKKTPPPVQQKSEGTNSPNTSVIGNNNTVTVNSPSSHNPQMPQPTFREKVDKVSFSMGEHGASFSRSIESLRKGPPWAPFSFGDTPNFQIVTMRVKGNTLLVHVKVGDGPDGPVIEVIDNEFSVRNLSFDKNSNERALEVVNQTGVPIFQLIQKTPTYVVVNGYFPLPNGGLIIAGPDGMTIGPNAADLAKFHLKPIFKYPGWKFPGQYAD